MNRRHFVHQTTATTLLTTAAGAVSISKAQDHPNDRITIGVIGVGKQGVSDFTKAMRMPQTQIVAMCDVVEERKNNGKKIANDFYSKLNNEPNYDGVSTHEDFREIINNEKIDAVMVVTPDHWHAIPVVQAAKAGKDIYCEKPISRTIEEGRAMVKAVQDNKVVFQTGSQQRSEYDGKFRIAAELVRNGRIGQIISVNIGIGDPSIPCDLPTEEIPKGTNWDLWLGPAEERGYNEILCPKGIHSHFPAWRRYREYAGGSVADFGAHHYDIAQWGLGTDDTGPVKLVPPSDPNAKRGMELIYENGIRMIHGGPGGTTWVGTSGIISVDRGRLEIIPNDLREKKPITDKDIKLENAGGRNGISHMANWIQNVKERGKCICHEEVGHRSASICHLTNIAYRLDRELNWDPKAEKFIDDGEANEQIGEPMRGDWKLS
ncbi:MAG: Gfo/Idh/MocA family oxidoreductase [Verrucomicrobiales bacterium]|nr:Gfo/Idh/MocA family oxidoreductase [Verrucomicrobiales bacterium]